MNKEIQTGNLVKVKDFKFLDGNEFKEKPLRKCLVLFKEEKEGENYFCVCPITHQLAEFNKKPENYFFLPLINQHPKKFDFVKLSSAVYVKESQIILTYATVGSQMMRRIYNKLAENYLIYDNEEYYKEVIHKIEKKCQPK